MCGTRDVPAPGAYVIKVTRWDRHFYAGVGYSVTSPANNPPKSPKLAEGGLGVAGLYGFVFSRDGVCRAHGASSEFVGRTLGQARGHMPSE